MLVLLRSKLIKINLFTLIILTLTSSQILASHGLRFETTLVPTEDQIVSHIVVQNQYGEDLTTLNIAGSASISSIAEGVDGRTLVLGRFNGTLFYKRQMIHAMEDDLFTLVVGPLGDTLNIQRFGGPGKDLPLGAVYTDQGFEIDMFISQEDDLYASGIQSLLLELDSEPEFPEMEDDDFYRSEHRVQSLEDDSGSSQTEDPEG